MKVLKFFHICSFLVKYAMSESVETWKGYVYAILMFVTAMLNSLLLQMLYKLSYDAGGRAKAGIISMVYKKVWITLQFSLPVFRHFFAMGSSNYQVNNSNVLLSIIFNKIIKQVEIKTMMMTMMMMVHL